MAGYIGSRASVVSSGAERKKTFAITTTTTVLTGLSYTPTFVHLFHNGVRLVDGTDYTATDGASLTLTSAAQSGDEVVVISYATFQPRDTVSASAGGTFAGDVSVTGAFTSLGIDDNATSTAVTIDASGNVGVGTAAPAYALDVASSVIQFGNSTDAFAQYKSSAGNWHVGANTSNAFVFYGGTYGAGVEHMRIDSSGNVGIGTASANSARLRLHNAGTAGTPQLMLTSVGTSSQSEIRHETSNALVFNNWNGASRTESMRIDATGSLILGVPGSNSNGKVIQANDGYIFFSSRVGTATATHNLFVNANGAVGSIQTTNSSTSYNTSSDYRLKENITPIQGAGDIVKAMRPCTYTFKADGDWADGFLAHELQELHPTAVSGSKDAMKDEEYEVTPAVYEDVITPAVEAVAEVPAVYDDEGVLVSEMVPAVEAQPERTEQQLVSEAVMGTRSVPDYQGVDYSKLTPILTAALQEALNKIDALEARLTALEATP